MPGKIRREKIGQLEEEVAFDLAVLKRQNSQGWGWGRLGEIKRNKREAYHEGDSRSKPENKLCKRQKENFSFYKGKKKKGIPSLTHLSSLACLERPGITPVPWNHTRASHCITCIIPLSWETLTACENCENKGRHYLLSTYAG